MPVKNVVKDYLAEGYYHVYNRGVNKRRIFVDDQDYKTFLSYLKIYLCPQNTDNLKSVLGDPEATPKQKDDVLRALRLNNFNNKVDLNAYNLMPNHFHFLLQQKEEWHMQSFLQSLITRYSMYFNKRHNRVGGLFESTYKAVRVLSNEQLFYVTRYIHRNSLGVIGLKGGLNDILHSQPSSYPNYLNEVHQEWVKQEDILANFSKYSGLNSGSKIFPPHSITIFAIASLLVFRLYLALIIFNI